MAPSRGLTTLLLPLPRLRLHHRLPRRFTTTPPHPSGHNRWSKIKHDKLKTDAAKTRQRALFAHEISLASKTSGPDPTANPRLADLITKAKREGFVKASIEAAIARGQGRSRGGAQLEALTVEGILPGNVGVLVECETDGKARSLMEVRMVLKSNGGSASPSSYLFTKRGRVVFARKEGVDGESAVEAALEAGATDVEVDGEGRAVLACETGDVKAVGEGVGAALGLQVVREEILWEANEETRVEVRDARHAEELIKVLDELLEDASVRGVVMNVKRGDALDGEIWKELQSRVAS
ncbi:YebC-like protein [Teratosphaeria nubilosa]|uniref:YebC-like protein n=1 Tax=Teratosphaeria nubilosa TaxID=161662 RepID=A0A6G1LFF5_9PEZI|nr:YebC-like protein [Teratosphaeria nubilosa]